MPGDMDPITEELFKTLRKLMRAYDQHASSLRNSSGISAPELLLLKAINNLGNASIGEVADEVSLSQATATTVVDKLEQSGLAIRQRSTVDRRKVHVALTEKGQVALEKSPPLMQRKFIEQFQKLEPYEQSSILSCMQKLAKLMQEPRLTSVSTTRANIEDKLAGVGY